MLLMQFMLFLQVARDEDITEQIGKNIYFDLVDHEKIKSFRIQKQTPFQLFKVCVPLPIISKMQNVLFFNLRQETCIAKKDLFGNLKSISDQKNSYQRFRILM